MAIVTQSTNRIDSFALAHGITESEVVRWNLSYFQENFTFWLPVGEDFRNAVPEPVRGFYLTLNGNIFLVNDKRLVIES